MVDKSEPKSPRYVGNVLFFDDEFANSSGRQELHEAFYVAIYRESKEE